MNMEKYDKNTILLQIKNMVIKDIVAII